MKTVAELFVGEEGSYVDWFTAIANENTGVAVRQRRNRNQPRGPKRRNRACVEVIHDVFP